MLISEYKGKYMYYYSVPITENRLFKYEGAVFRITSEVINMFNISPTEKYVPIADKYLMCFLDMCESVPAKPAKMESNFKRT